MSPPKTLRCGIYTRKSTEEGLEQAFNSLDAQREACEAYIKSQTGEGWVALPARYDDGGFSGGNMERPGLKGLLSDIDRGLVDVVVVYKVDRLTRALADFAKIVERFDKRGVSFVSVTQAFNTTTSMGRLTLNVLLSFAQFEREVTSERIRDKLAASRRKGMWMGGRAPFGYAVVDKKLIPHETEMPILRRIFAQYLELGSVRALSEALKAEGIVSKAWVSRHGHQNGGVPFGRGALYDLLQNRIYVGEIRHKEERHKGQHDGIVPPKLFDEVQDHLAAGRQRELGRARSSVRYPLTGLLWDDAGNRMSPTNGKGKTGRRFRYYVSRPLLKGEPADASVMRIPAGPIEELILNRITRLVGTNIRKAKPVPSSEPDDTGTLSLVRVLVERIEIGAEGISIRLRRDQLAIKLMEYEGRGKAAFKVPDIDGLQRHLETGDRLVETDDRLDLILAARPVRRGGATMIEIPDADTGVRKPRHDPALLKAIARAHGWLAMMLTGEADTLRAVAARVGVKERYIRRIIPLAFLPPAELALALEGRQPSTLTVDRIVVDDLPLAWAADTARA